MAAYKDTERNTWYVAFYYRDWQGNNKKKKKRGFKTKREALDWEKTFRQKQEASLDMLFKDFVEVYAEDMKPRLKYNTWLTKEHIIKTKLLPYFGNKKMNEIKAADVVRWQNEMMSFRDEDGNGYSKVYLKTLQSQLSAIFNHGIRLYELKENPVRKAGSMGGERRKEMLVWTKEEYKKFSEAIIDKPQAYYAFEVLFWTGLRVGELLALTPADIDFSAVEQNYAITKKEKETNILPLVLDLCNPAASVGWANEERSSFFERIKDSELVLALALVHHLAIGRNVPFSKIAKLFSSAGKNLIVEYVDKKDSQVEKLLSNRKDIFDDYSIENFEKSFGGFFDIVEKRHIDNTFRTIYLMRRKEK